jgi:hypothetical protein
MEPIGSFINEVAASSKKNVTNVEF